MTTPCDAGGSLHALAVTPTPRPGAGDPHPTVRLDALDAVWFQVAGTICNIRCRHCFISCAPENDNFGFMSAELVRAHLEDARRLGAKEFYFTGGEPFAHPDICDILEAALARGPTTVLTNAMLLKPGTLDRLERMHRESPHALTLRVSLDGYNAAMNDRIRGEGVFDATLDGLRQILARGIEPIVTIVRTWDGCDDAVIAAFTRTLRAAGYDRPKLKVMPSLKLGAEAQRTRGYTDCERVTHDMMAGYDQSNLLCNRSRLVTDRGVWVCPILLDSPEARMGDTLAETLRPYPLRHGACVTCWRHGAICSNSTVNGGGCCSGASGTAPP